MGRAPLAAFLAVLSVGALAAWSHLSGPREVIVSTPSAYTGITVPLDLPGRGEACADEILFDTNAEVARFGATAPEGAVAPDLEVLALGSDEGPYRSDYREVVRVDGGWTGTRQLDVPLDPPRSEAFGEFCVRNLGDDPVALVGTLDGRAYSRPTVSVNGEEVETELELRFLEAGRRSLLSRAGQITEQAATLRPFGAWWWWLLGIALVVLAPLAMAVVIRSALTADAAVLREGRAPMAGWPSERLRRRAAAIPGWALLAAFGALAVAYLFFWAFSTHVFQNDEDQYVYLSRWLQNDLPASLWNFDMYGRGLQRLEVWLLAIPSALFDAPWSLHGGRFLNIVAYVSTAIPVYLLGRGMGLKAPWAVLPAAMSVLAPWSVVTTTFLTESVAYPACLWAVWAFWRTTVTPGPWRDLLALVLLVVAGASRSGLLVLAPVLPLAVLAVGMRFGTGGALARLRALLRSHAVLWIAVALAALPLLLAPLGVTAADTFTQRVTGGYSTQIGLDAWTQVEKAGRYFSRIVVGTAFLPAAVALPWLVTQLVRPREARGYALAAVLVLSALAILYQLGPAGPDERYILYLAPLVLLPATIAVVRREVSPVGLGIASVLLAALLLRVTWSAEQGGFGFFVSPAEMFYTRVVGLKLAQYLPGDGSEVRAGLTIALAAACVALAVMLRRAPGRLSGRPGILLVTAVVLAVPLQAHYVMAKYAANAGARSGPNLNSRSFADRLTPDDATVGALLEGFGQTPESFPLWQEVQFYNERIETSYALGPNQNPIPPGDFLVDGMSYDDRTGRVSSSLPLTDYLVIPTQLGVVRLRGEIVFLSDYISFALQRVDRPAQLEWRTSGFDPLSVVPEDGAGSIRFYGTGLDRGAPRCATFTLAAPLDREVAWSLESGGREVGAGTLAAGERKATTAPLPRLMERGFTDVRARGDGLQVLAAGLGC